MTTLTTWLLGIIIALLIGIDVVMTKNAELQMKTVNMSETYSGRCR